MSWDTSIELERQGLGQHEARNLRVVTGSLDPSEIDKVAIKNNTANGSWVRAVSVQAILEIVNPREDPWLRPYEGWKGSIGIWTARKKWLPLESLGILRSAFSAS